MPIILAGTAVAQSSAGVGTLNITLPSTIVADDYILIAAELTSDAGWNTPSGYSIVSGPWTKGTSLGLIVYGKKAVSGDAGSTVTIDPTTSTQRVTVEARIYRGVDATTPLDGVTPTHDTGATLTVTAPTITPTTSASTVVSFHAVRIPSSHTSNTWTAPSGFGNSLFACSTNTSNGNGSMASYDEASVTGATGTITATSTYGVSPGAWIAAAVVLKPSSSTLVEVVRSENLFLAENLDAQLFSTQPPSELADVLSPGATDDQQTATLIRQFGEDLNLDETVTTTLTSGRPVTVELKTGAVWTDITAYVPMGSDAGIRVRRGREHEFDTVQPGGLSLLLDNFDGRFTPGAPLLSDGATANPLYPYIRVNTPIRVTLFSGTARSTRFTGFVDEWPLSWDGGVLGRVSLTATDAFKMFANRKLRDANVEQAAADGATSLYPLSDPDGAADVVDILGGGPAGQLTLSKTPGSVLYAQPGPRNGLTGMTFLPNPTAPSGVAARFARPLVSAAPFTLEVWFKATGKIGVLYHQRSVRTVFGEHSRDPIEFTTVALREGTTAGTLLFYASNLGLSSEQSAAASLSSFNDGHWHYVVCGIHDDMRTPFLRVDGFAQPHMQRSLADLDALASEVRYTELAGSTVSQEFFNGTLEGFAVYPTTALSLAQIGDHYLGGANGNTGERSDQRIARMLSWAGATGNLEAGYSTVGVQDTAGRSLLECLQQVEQTEQGTFFIAGDGTPTFHNRYHASTVSALALTGAQIDPSFQQSEDDRLLVNEITVSGSEVGPITVTDETSEAQYGTYSASVDTLLTSAVEVQAFGGYRIAKYAQPTPRSPSATVDWLTQGSLGAELLDTDIGTPVTLAGLPAQAAATGDLEVESVAEVFHVDERSVTFTLGSADLGNFAIYDTSDYDDGSVYAW